METSIRKAVFLLKTIQTLAVGVGSDEAKAKKAIEIVAKAITDYCPRCICLSCEKKHRIPTPGSVLEDDKE